MSNDPRGFSHHHRPIKAMIFSVDEPPHTMSGQIEVAIEELDTERRGVICLSHPTTIQQTEVGGIATFRSGSLVHWIDE